VIKVCGIAGIIGLNNRDSIRDVIERQIESIRHRGPDSIGISILNEVGFGMARLSIMDVKTGHQPAFSKSRQVMVVFNGEIYNYKELIKQNSMLSAGMSEAEVIANLFEFHGSNFVSKLDGFFAIAIWDFRDKKLVLIRDRFGKKPLYYALINGVLIFGSEVKAILKAGIKASPDFRAIQDVLEFGYVKTPRTGFEDIYQLSPATFLEFSKSTVTESTYWQLEKDSEYSKLDINEATEIFKAKLFTSVSKRLNAERPLGLFLSGGIDSSLIAVALKELGTSVIETFSAGFDEQDFNESNHAADISNYLGIRNNRVLIKPSPDFLVSTYPKFMDIPYADSSFIPTYLLSHYASSRIKVALSGDGGDEAFGGYDRYRVNLLLDSFLSKLPVLKFVPTNRVKDRRISKFLRSLRENQFLIRYESMLRLQSVKESSDLFTSRGTLAQSNSRNNSESLKWDKDEKIRAMQRHDVSHYLPGDLLVKMDMASMANGLEVRSPFLDPDLFVFGYSLSKKLKVSLRIGKVISRNLLSQSLPPHLFERPKQGFAIPRAQWLRNSMKTMASDILLGSNFKQRGWFSQELTKEVFLKHQSGWDLDEYLWPILMIEIWALNWIDSY